MTLRELSQLYWLNREIERDVRRLRELQGLALPGSPSAGGGAGGRAAYDRVGLCAAELADLESVIREKLRAALAERCRLERYIASVDDSLLRQVLTLRFVSGLSWRKVADELGGGNTADGCRMMVLRRLERR